MYKINKELSEQTLEKPKCTDETIEENHFIFHTIHYKYKGLISNLNFFQILLIYFQFKLKMNLQIKLREKF
ncbi:hypothetical protein BpHYR1_007072 [Brachionus plicatilis]|uniref:Uncharacterized protein n=1 Tax=Brachionus plicatilis TaxID=10195 RepID=A0A3M7PM65_BRAPC|nr:hypothetical protein BpHYR1_007072 [Brachionus plicatilis]